MKGAAFLLPALFRILVLPILIVQPILRFLPDLTLFRLVAYLLSFALVYAVRGRLDVWSTSRQASAQGAADVPLVNGRWPFNLDIVRDWAKSGSEDEVARMMFLLGRQYGSTYNTRVIGENQILSTDPKVFKHALVDDSNNFVKGKKFKDRAEGFLGDGIFNSDGERWKFHRTLLRPFFHPSHVSHKLFIPFIQRFLNNLPSGEEACDIQARFRQLALETALMWMTGTDIGDPSSKGSAEWEQSKNDLGWALVEAQRVVGRRVKIGTVWPLLELGYDPLARPMQVIRTFFAPLITAAVSRRDQQVQDSLRAGDEVHLIDRLIEATEDMKLVEDQLINVLLASRDTTSSLLTFCTYALALYPDVADRLRGEVRSVVIGDVNKGAIRECRLCRGFINETLRLFPPVPLNIRRTLRPSLLRTSAAGPPLFMPANTSIILAFILMQRDQAVWGENALDFDIDRWLKGGLDIKESEGFMSWNAGPRMCLGQPFALTLVHTFLILLFRHLDSLGSDRGENESSGSFQLQLAVDAQPAETRMPESWKGKEGDGRARDGRDRVWIMGDVILTVKGGLWVRLAQAAKL
ncbi:cytochrome P450 [Naematelia encephala]|uniref:Cytochrome P450 n=1 Tax=Naematelia encephala TaxID=71784 RepID=A0A1Y2AH94_9TREE|nr:cytochrome P450 [Naematelia encephala]